MGTVNCSVEHWKGTLLQIALEKAIYSGTCGIGRIHRRIDQGSGLEAYYRPLRRSWSFSFFDLGEIDRRKAKKLLLIRDLAVMGALVWSFLVCQLVDSSIDPARTKPPSPRVLAQLHTIVTQLLGSQFHVLRVAHRTPYISPTPPCVSILTTSVHFPAYNLSPTSLNSAKCPLQPQCPPPTPTTSAPTP